MPRRIDFTLPSGNVAHIYQCGNCGYYYGSESVAAECELLHAYPARVSTTVAQEEITNVIFD